MSDARFLQLAHDLIEALKVAKGRECDDAEVRNIVTGGITNDRDVLLDEIRWCLTKCGNTSDPASRQALARIAGMSGYERAAICAHAAMIIRERAIPRPRRRRLPSPGRCGFSNCVGMTGSVPCGTSCV